MFLAKLALIAQSVNSVSLPTTTTAINVIPVLKIVIIALATIRVKLVFLDTFTPNLQMPVSAKPATL